jgi:hypothetical protein
MKKDVRKKSRPLFRVSSEYVQRHLLELLKLTDELNTAYDTYPRLQRLIGREAWQQLTDVPYRQLLELNLNPRKRSLRDAYAKNQLRLEDMATSMVVRDRSGLRQTLSQVLIYRIENGLATKAPGRLV